MERVTKRAFQGAAGEAAIRFHMADHRLNGTSTPQVAPERWGHPALLPGDVDRRDHDSRDPRRPASDG